jgi:DNA-binding transcriptional LysR family regulator
MRAAHSLGGVHLDLLRSFLLVAERGSLNKAAAALRMSQSTLTRQMHALEQEIGGALFERSSTGVALTATGNVLLESARPALASLDQALGEARRLARGQSERLRIGYIMSAASDYLNPALAALRRAHPEVKVTLLDLSPGEQIAALRRGEIDLALFGNVGASLAKEFYLRKIASLPVWVALAETHPLAERDTVRLAELKRELFVGALESDLPGYNRWLVQICRRAGFRPKLLGDAESLTHGFSLAVSDGALSLVPKFAAQARVPGVVFRPLADGGIHWELLLAWQRGKISAPVKAMLTSIGPR